MKNLFARVWCFITTRHAPVLLETKTSTSRQVIYTGSCRCGHKSLSWKRNRTRSERKADRQLNRITRHL